MPAKKAHVVLTAAISLVTAFFLYNNAFSVIIFTALAVSTATLPDRIERPTSRYHRGFFHSLFLLGILIILMTYTVSSPLSGLIFGYITHLVVDYSRTTYIPLI